MANKIMANLVDIQVVVVVMNLLRFSVKPSAVIGQSRFNLVQQRTVSVLLFITEEILLLISSYCINPGILKASMAGAVQCYAKLCCIKACLECVCRRVCRARDMAIHKSNEVIYKLNFPDT